MGTINKFIRHLTGESCPFGKNRTGILYHCLAESSLGIGVDEPAKSGIYIMYYCYAAAHFLLKGWGTIMNEHDTLIS